MKMACFNEVSHFKSKNLQSNNAFRLEARTHHQYLALALFHLEDLLLDSRTRTTGFLGK